MPLTLNEFLFLVMTIAVVVAVTFLVFFLAQLRKTAKEGEKTLIEMRELAKELRDLDKKVKAKVEDIGELIETSKKTASAVSEAAFFMTAKIIKPSSKYWPLLFPLLRFAWRQIKKRKEGKNGE